MYICFCDDVDTYIQRKERDLFNMCTRERIKVNASFKYYTKQFCFKKNKSNRLNKTETFCATVVRPHKTKEKKTHIVSQRKIQLHTHIFVHTNGQISTIHLF
jgi:hypothetical protein